MDLHDAVDGSGIAFFTKQIDELVAELHLLRREHECLFVVFDSGVGLMEFFFGDFSGVCPCDDAHGDVFEVLRL